MRHLTVPDSSNVQSIAYDPELRALEVRFSSGDLYAYDGVEPDVFVRVATGPSVGKALTALLKSDPDRYPHRVLHKEPRVPRRSPTHSMVLEGFDAQILDQALGYYASDHEEAPVDRVKILRDRLRATGARVEFDPTREDDVTCLHRKVTATLPARCHECGEIVES